MLRYSTEGLSSQEVADRHGIAQVTVHYWLDRYQIALADYGPDQLDEQSVAKLRRWYSDEGDTVEQIAERLDISESWTLRLLLQAGAELRRPGRQPGR